jgi:hypothetical protein
MVSASVAQMNGSQWLFQESMKRPIVSASSRAEAKLPRRMAWRVMIPKKTSTTCDPDLTAEQAHDV